MLAISEGWKPVGKGFSVKEDKQKELKESYDQLSRSEKIYVILVALGTLVGYRIRQIPILWVLLQIKIDLKLRRWD
jgi:hypothetical protein